jgi:hypothetical protein
MIYMVDNILEELALVIVDVTVDYRLEEVALVIYMVILETLQLTVIVYVIVALVSRSCPMYV